MSNQAKRWTATRDSKGCYVVSETHRQMAAVPKWDDAWEIATRLAACADLLREHDDLSGVVVMRRGDVEKVREALEWFRGKAIRDGDLYSESRAGEGLHFLPKPSRSESEGG